MSTGAVMWNGVASTAATSAINEGVAVGAAEAQRRGGRRVSLR